MILPPLRFCVKSHFGEFKWSKNVVFGNFRGSEFWFLVNLSNFKVPNYPNSKFSISKIAINDIFGLFEFAKMWFHAKSEWWWNHQISTKSSLNFTFWNFLEHSVGGDNIEKLTGLCKEEICLSGYSIDTTCMNINPYLWCKVMITFMQEIQFWLYPF